MATEIVPLAAAARRMGRTVSDLKRLCESGIIKSAFTHQGEWFVADTELQPDELRDKFKKLAGHPITVTDAADKYDVPYHTIRNWTRLYPNQLRVIESGYRMKLDEQDVAVCVTIYKQHKKARMVAPLFDEVGRPYQLKRPEIAAYRKRKKGVA
jgi:hypothetical protein